MLGSALHAHWGLRYDCEHERGLWPPSSLLLLFSGSLGIRHRYSQATHTHAHTQINLMLCRQGCAALTKVKHHLIDKIAFYRRVFCSAIPGFDQNLQRSRREDRRRRQKRFNGWRQDFKSVFLKYLQWQERLGKCWRWERNVSRLQDRRDHNLPLKDPKFALKIWADPIYETYIKHTNKATSAFETVPGRCFFSPNWSAMVALDCKSEFRLILPSGLWGHGGSTPDRAPGERSRSFDWHVVPVQIVPSWLLASWWSWAGMFSGGQAASSSGLRLPTNLTLGLKYKSGPGHYFTLSSNTTKTPKQR